MPTLAAGASSTGTVKITIPSTTASGTDTYYLLACADDTVVVIETDDNNNCIASAANDPGDTAGSHRNGGVESAGQSREAG